MKPVKALVLNRINRPYILQQNLAQNMQAKQFIINRSESIQINISFFHLLGYMFSYSCTYNFDVCFVSFSIFRGSSKENYVSFRSSALLKIFLSKIFTFLICLKNYYISFKLVSFFLSHTNTRHKFRFQLMNTIFHCLSPISGFSFHSNLHTENLFVILRNTKFHNIFCIWVVNFLKSTTR